MILLTFVVLCFNQKKQVLGLAADILRNLPSSCDVLIVDDCSQDPVTNFDVCHLPRCTVLNSTCNYGPGFQRNRAIQAVESKYIAFIDGDDGVKAFIDTPLINSLQFSSVDIVIFKNHSPRVLSALNQIPLQLLSILRALQCFDKVSFVNKLFRVSWLRSRHIHYSTRRLYEDVLFHYLACMHKPKVRFFGGPFYDLNIDLTSRSRIPRSLSFRARNFAAILTELHSHTPVKPSSAIVYMIYVSRLFVSLLWTTAPFRQRLSLH